MKKQQAKKYYVYTIAYFDQIMYVGKTSNMSVRKSAHKTKRGTFQSAIPVDVDMSKVVFNVVAEFDNKEEALKYEDELILQYNILDGGWNKYRSGLVCSDKEYVLAYMQDYNAAHKEEKAVYNRDYYKTNRECIRAQHRDYYEANREYILVQKRDYNQEYYQAHRHEINAKRRERRARKKAEGAK